MTEDPANTLGVPQIVTWTFGLDFAVRVTADYFSQQTFTASVKVGTYSFVWEDKTNYP
jgi:hypothetical protein